MDLAEPTIESGLSRDDARRAACTILARVSGEEAALDARIFLEEATGLSRITLWRDGDEPIGQEAAVRLAASLRRRLAGEPVWRIIGRREFWGLDFRITSDVLDPRPDTETLVAAALAALATRRADPLTVLDLGVGSGAILGALLHELPQARGWGLDRSETACRVAERNLVALGLSARALVIAGHWGDAVADGVVDLVVSNPPYIESAVIESLAPEVRTFDPRAALDGGLDGLDHYRTIIAALPRLLAPDGIVALEVGAGQADQVRALLVSSGFPIPTVHRDLGGHERAVVASRADGPAGKPMQRRS